MSGLFTPKFRKLNAVSSRMAPEMASVADTVITPTVFGRMCRKMIRRLDAPTERAASTNSFSRSERNSPRTMRASEVQVTRPSSTPEPDDARAADLTGDHRRDGQQRNGDHHVGEAHQDRLDPTPEVPGDRADDRCRSMVLTMPTMNAMINDCCSPRMVRAK